MADKAESAMPILSRLKPPKGAVRARRRVGRGEGSGLGKTCGHGQKGQKSRSGSGAFIGFEGGQMPLQRRLPKVGFYNLFAREVTAVNVCALERLKDVSVVDPEVLIEAGLLRKKHDTVKILGRGELSRALTVRAHAFSAGAREKIERAGGKAEVIEALARDPKPRVAESAAPEGPKTEADAPQDEPKTEAEKTETESE
jgi:large subunit ribosomal protein L15